MMKNVVRLVTLCSVMLLGFTVVSLQSPISAKANMCTYPGASCVLGMGGPAVCGDAGNPPPWCMCNVEGVTNPGPNSTGICATSY